MTRVATVALRWKQAELVYHKTGEKDRNSNSNRYPTGKVICRINDVMINVNDKCVTAMAIVMLMVKINIKCVVRAYHCDKHFISTIYTNPHKAL